MAAQNKEVDLPALYKRITDTGIQGDLSKFSEEERSILQSALLSKTKVHCSIANPTDFQFYTKIIEESTALTDFSFSINCNNVEAQQKLHHALQKNPHLTRLAVGSKIGRDKTIEALAAITKLEEFEVFNILFEHEAALLLPLLKSGTFRGLHLRSEIYSETFWPEFSTILENNTTLESLTICGNDSAVLGVASAAKKNKNLKRIKIEGKLSVAGMSDLFGALEHNSTIEKLDLPMLADERNEELVNLWKAVGEGRIHIRNFDLTQANLKQAEYEALGAALQTNNAVNSLKLTVNDNEYLQLLDDGLRSNKCLKELDLTNSNLDQDCLKTLVEALGARIEVPELPQESSPEQPTADPADSAPVVDRPVNSTLTTLSLELCKIKNGDLLGALLKQNSSLTSLNVSRNPLSYGPICEALKTNRTIAELDIQVRDRPSEEDLTLLRDMLTLNDTLRTLKLSVVQEELDSLCEGLKSNRGITTLIIKEKRWNNPGEDAALVLQSHHEEMLSQNTTLTTVEIFLPRQVIPQLENILSRNRSNKSEGTA